jgi:hypothetical protein
LSLKPQHIELEPKWTVGHGASGGRADIMVKDNSNKSLLIIECKTAGKEFNDEWKKMLINGGQVLSYGKQAGSTSFVSLYTSDIIDEEIVPSYFLITLRDNENLLDELADKAPLSYERAKLLDKEDIYKAIFVAHSNLPYLRDQKQCCLHSLRAGSLLRPKRCPYVVVILFVFLRVSILVTL